MIFHDTIVIAIVIIVIIIDNLEIILKNILMKDDDKFIQIQIFLRQNIKILS
jgi:hypothetical protein